MGPAGRHRLVRLSERDVAVVTGPSPYVVGDQPDTEPQLRIPPGGVCEPLPARRARVRPDGPRLRLRLRLRRWLAEVAGSVMEIVLGEIQRDEPGQQSVLDRWLDLALITTLRAWFARPESHAPGWYRAQSDPVASHALRLIHEDPAYPWSVVELAQRVGVSRASLARRFTAVVGDAPMSYLTGWRITLAADLLRDTSDTVETIARRVGYANAFAPSVDPVGDLKPW
jgi:AraC-like DNA-binding protein